MKTFHRLIWCLGAALVATTGAIADTATKSGFTITPSEMQ
jgi:hypothetical protein